MPVAGPASAKRSYRRGTIRANANAGPDTIAFNIAGSGVHTITLASALAPLTSPVTILCGVLPAALAVSLAGAAFFHATIERRFLNSPSPSMSAGSRPLAHMLTAPGGQAVAG